MRVLQIIDTLRSGGAEQMAVSYANALAKQIDGSYLCCTRQGGLLKKKLSGDVGYLFLKKKHALDLLALRRLRKFVQQNEIDLVQAHGTSWFLGALLKLSLPKVKLVWHDHYGRDLQQRKAGLLKPASGTFDGIISVNENLKKWAEEELGVKEVRYFKNFLPGSSSVSALCGNHSLSGIQEDFKIICVANFRPQKDHINLLSAFEILLRQEEKVSLHLVGNLERNVYTEKVKRYITDKHLENRVFIYGEQQNVEGLLRQANLGVLSSASEGLPVALLEYGRAGLPVVVTGVGEVPDVVGKNGKIVPPGNPQELASAMQCYLQNQQKRSSDAEDFRDVVQRQFSEEAVLPRVLQFFSALLQRNVKQGKVL